MALPRGYSHIEIRPARIPEDLPAIQAVNEQAFARNGSGTFEKLLASAEGITALLAVSGSNVIGDIIFAPAVVDTTSGPLQGMGLGELGVRPAFQRQGVGQALVHAGLEQLRAKDCPFVLVVGHANYYPRFGFVPGSRLGLRCQWSKVPEESFMVLVLDTAAMADAAGVVRFRDIQ